MDTMKIDATSDLTKADVKRAIRTAHDIKQGLFMRYLDDEMTHYLQNTVKKNLRKITEDDNPGYLRYSDHTMVYVPAERPIKDAKDMLLIASDFAYKSFKGDLQAAFDVFGYDIQGGGAYWPGLSIDRSFNDLKEDMDNAKVIGVITGSDTEFLDKVIHDYEAKVVIIPNVVEFDSFDDVYNQFYYESDYAYLESEISPINDSFKAVRKMIDKYESVTDDDFKPYLTSTDVDTPMTSSEYHDLERVTRESVIIKSIGNYYLDKRIKNVLEDEGRERKQRVAENNE